VGYKSALEDIITLTDIKTLDDFEPAVCVTGQAQADDSRRGRHADFYFQIPTTSNGTASDGGKRRPLPLSTIVTGTTRSPTAQYGQTTSASLNGNESQLVRGECEVSYWIEAQFRRAGQQVGFLSEPVNITSLYPRLQVSLGGNSMKAKPDLLARCKYLLQKTAPDLSVTLYEPDVKIERDAVTGKRHIVLPLAVSMDLPTPATAATATAAPRSKTIDSRQSFKCSVEAKWEVITRFSALPAPANAERLRPGEMIRKTTVASTHKSTILFRPLPRYDESSSPNLTVKSAHATPSYIATSQIDLAVPAAVSQPSLRWEHFSRTYSLDLTLNFHGLQGAPKYTIHSNIPLSITSYGTKAEDVLKDGMVVNVASADSDDDDEEDDDDSDEDEIEPSRAPPPPTAQTQIPISRKRTPPPPYFR
jgi:hypothetical protein